MIPDLSFLFPRLPWPRVGFSAFFDARRIDQPNWPMAGGSDQARADHRPDPLGSDPQAVGGLGDGKGSHDGPFHLVIVPSCKHSVLTTNTFFLYSGDPLPRSKLARWFSSWASSAASRWPDWFTNRADPETVQHRYVFNALIVFPFVFGSQTPCGVSPPSRGARQWVRRWL